MDFEASLDADTRTVTWKLTTIDPASCGLPSHPTAGFFPPDDDAHRGEGFVNYKIQPKANLAKGTVINAEAKIIFDTNAPINTPIWTNTVDVDIPTSTVTTLPTTPALLPRYLLHQHCYHVTYYKHTQFFGFLVG